MKSFFFAVATSLLFSIPGISHAQTSTNNRVSPMDSVKAQIQNLDIEIVYSRPYLKGREFGKDIVPYGKLWRTGANEATTFEISNDIAINDKVLPAGKYSLYTIPNEDKTIVIFNKEWNQWGTKYDESQDVLRIEVPTEKIDEPVEQFTIEVEDDGDVELAWGTFECGFKIKES